MMKFKVLPCLLFCVMWSACSTSSTITNLTPSQVRRNPSGLYTFEVVFETNQRSLRHESIQPAVVIGSEFYRLESAPVLKNRWETLIQIPADQKFIYYQFKFDYDYYSMPQSRSSSRLSPPYKLEILDK